MFFKRVEKNIAEIYGYQQFYQVLPIVKEITQIRKKLLPNIEVKNVSQEDFVNPEKMNSLLKNNDEARPLYLSISLLRNKNFKAGSAICLTAEQFIAMKMAGMSSSGEEKLSSELSKLMEEISQSVLKEKQLWEHYRPQNQYEKEVFEILNKGSYISLNHNVLIKIDPQSNCIFYKDPYGASMPDNIKLYFQEHPQFKNYKLYEDSAKQQHPDDHCNCPIFSTLNLVTLSNHRGNNSPDYVLATPANYSAMIEKTKKDMIKIIGLDGVIAKLETESLNVVPTKRKLSDSVTHSVSPNPKSPRP